MCNAACIDEAINRVPIEMCIFSKLIDISEMPSSCLRWSLMFWTTFRVYSPFPEACVSARPPEYSKLYSRFPEACWAIRIFHLFPPESLLYSPGFEGYSNKFVPQLCIVAKRDNMLSLSWLANKVKSFPEIFSTFQIAFLRKENGCKSGYKKNVVSFMIVQRCNKWCHSSRVKLPFVKMSASWFVDSTYLIWTVGSRLILSNNQSRANRWVRDTCLIVGLPPLMIYLYHSFVVFENVQLWQIHILIQHLLNLGCALGLNTGFPCACLGWFLVFFGSFPALQWPNPTSQVQVNRPYANQHPTIWSPIL